MHRRAAAGQAKRLPSTIPILWQGIRRRDAIVGLKAETAVIGRVAEDVDVSGPLLFQTPQTRVDNRAANALALPRRSNRKRCEERDLVKASRDAACGEHDMTGKDLISSCNEREDRRSFIQQVAHNWQQILIWECLRINLLNKGDVVRPAFARFNCNHDVSAMVPQSDDRQALCGIIRVPTSGPKGA